MALKAARMKKELEMLQKSPPPGVSCWIKENDINSLEAVLQGATGTPYEGGTFYIAITIPDRYPFEPPLMKFKTPVYHPNIDNNGLICMDLLKMPPAGNWRPSINLSTLLTSLQLLLAEPNPNDPLMADIAREFLTNRSVFEEKARQWTKDKAMKKEQRGGEKRKSTELSPQRDCEERKKLAKLTE